MTTTKPRADHNPEYKLGLIFGKCVPNGECLEWTGNYFRQKTKPNWQYPYIYFKKKVWRGNRLVLFLLTGEEPKGMYALHKCDNNKCLNPTHLYWGTPAQNVRDTVDRNRHREKQKTHCPKKHEYNEQNTIVRKNKRYCRECYNIANRTRYSKEKAKESAGMG